MKNTWGYNIRLFLFNESLEEKVQLQINWQICQEKTNLLACSQMKADLSNWLTSTNQEVRTQKIPFTQEA